VVVMVMMIDMDMDRGGGDDDDDDDDDRREYSPAHTHLVCVDRHGGRCGGSTQHSARAGHVLVGGTAGLFRLSAAERVSPAW
jgi:hypothetical protein